VNKCKNCQAVLPSRVEGQRGRVREYCNKSCYAIANGYLKSALKPEFCLWCGVALDQVDKPGNPKRYCSRQHASAYRQANKAKAPIVVKTCKWCNKGFETNLKQTKYCSAKCRNAFYGDIKIKVTVAKQAANPRRFDFDCERCGQVVTTDKHVTRGAYGRYCRSCALVKRRERYRIKTAKRQKITNPIRISADVIIERDGNVCHLCDSEIDLTLARNSRFGATIDHVVPVSKGGADTLENMRLAHWICNIKKGNRVDG
jgi:hypothetical protein